MSEAQQTFPCARCGSDMQFDPATGDLLCPHCGNREEIAGTAGGLATALRELDFESAVDEAAPAVEIETTRVVHCPNCGADIEFGEDEHATVCPFCATPLVAGTGSHRHIKPRGVLPFAIGEPAAHEAMSAWLGRLWFAPNGLRDYARKGRRMSGIYVPYWTFDAQTQSRYSGERGTVYYVTQTVVRNGRREQVQVPKVRWRGVSGRVARAFDDVLVLASTSLPKAYTDALPPWDLSALQPYRPEFLAGFSAEAYSVALRDGFAEARGIMARAIERDVRFDIGGDRQRIHGIDTETRAVTFKHILLPVWVAAYKYRGQTYRFVVNGQSGRVQGERPWSAAKIALAVIAGLILAAIVGYLGAQGG